MIRIRSRLRGFPGALRRGGALAAASAFLVVPVVVIAGPAAPAYAFVDVPPSPVKVTSTVLEKIGTTGGVLDVAAATGDGAALDVVAGAAAGATIDATGAIVLGSLAGYAIGWAGIKAWNWAWGGSHVVNGDAPLPTGADWSPQDYLTSTHATGLVSFGNPVASAITGTTQLVQTYTFSWAGSGLPSDFSSIDVRGEGECQESGGPVTYVGPSSFSASVGNTHGTMTITASCVAPAAPIGARLESMNGSTPIASIPPIEYLTGYKPPAPNPVRTLHVTADCKAVDGTVSEVTADSAPFTETDGTFPAVPPVACADGSQLIGYDVVETSPGLDNVNVLHWDAPPEYSGISDTYPGCGTGACVLRLYAIDPATGSKVDCFGAGTLCKGWVDDPTRDTDYQCWYGTYLVSLDECRVYDPTFDDPVADPKYGDPATPLPDPAPNPAPTDGTDCPPPLHFGLSLVSPWWYFHIGQCVLEWAFIPDPAAVTSDIGNVKDAFDSSGVGEVSGYVGGFFTPIINLAGQGSGDCEGLSLSIDFSLPLGGQDHPYSMDDMHPFSSCSGLAKYINDFYMPLITALIYLGGFMVGAKIFLGAIGINVPWVTDDDVMVEWYNSEAYKTRHH